MTRPPIKRPAPKKRKKPEAPADIMKQDSLWKIAGHGKNGRPRLFETPDELLAACEEYFRWCEAHPLMQTDFRGKDVQEVLLPHPRAFTLSGLMVYLGTSEKYWQWFRASMTEQKNEAFLYIIAHVEQTIRTQKFEYAAAGFFNSNLIARDLGMVEKQELTGSNGSPLVPPVVQLLRVQRSTSDVAGSEQEIKDKENL